MFDDLISKGDSFLQTTADCKEFEHPTSAVVQVVKRRESSSSKCDIKAKPGNKDPPSNCLRYMEFHCSYKNHECSNCQIELHLEREYNAWRNRNQIFYTKSWQH